MDVLIKLYKVTLLVVSYRVKIGAKGFRTRHIMHPKMLFLIFSKPSRKPKANIGLND